MAILWKETFNLKGIFCVLGLKILENLYKVFVKHKTLLKYGFANIIQII